MLNHMDAPCFSTDAAAQAAGMERDALVSLLRRHVLADETRTNELSPGIGRPRQFTMRQTLHLALTRALMGWGMDAGHASILALQWTHQPVPGAFMVGQSPDDRTPGGVFADQPTWFRVMLGRNGYECAIERSVDIAKDPLPPHGTSLAAQVNLTELLAEVKQSLAA